MNLKQKCLVLMILFSALILARIVVGSEKNKGFLESLFENTVGYKGTPSRFQRDLATTLRISEISLERTDCLGICSSYTVKFFSDGKAVFEGKKNIEPLGLWIGKTSKEDFTYLAEAAIDISYFTLLENYQSLTTDQQTVFTSVVLDGKRKIILNYGNAAPPRLWLFESAIDQLRASIAWKKN